MKIEHIAIWTKKLEEMKEFYEKFFQGKANEKYINQSKHFESYFISFKDGTRLELMKSSLLKDKDINKNEMPSGYAHMAFSVGSKEKVDELTNLLREQGYEIKGGPRFTGDGYYESSFLDPDGNLVEITS